MGQKIAQENIPVGQNYRSPKFRRCVHIVIPGNRVRLAIAATGRVATVIFYRDSSVANLCFREKQCGGAFHVVQNLFFTRNCFVRDEVFL